MYHRNPLFSLSSNAHSVLFLHLWTHFSSIPLTLFCNYYLASSSFLWSIMYFLWVFLHLWFCFFLVIFSHVVTFVCSASFLCVSPVIYGERNTLTNLLGSLSLLFNYCLFTFSISALILSLPPVLLIFFYFNILDTLCLSRFSFLILYPSKLLSDIKAEQCFES